MQSTGQGTGLGLSSGRPDSRDRALGQRLSRALCETSKAKRKDQRFSFSEKTHLKTEAQEQESLKKRPKSWAQQPLRLPTPPQETKGWRRNGGHTLKNRRGMLPSQDQSKGSPSSVELTKPKGLFTKEAPVSTGPGVRTSTLRAWRRLSSTDTLQLGAGVCSHVCLGNHDIPSRVSLPTAQEKLTPDPRETAQALGSMARGKGT